MCIIGMIRTNKRRNAPLVTRKSLEECKVQACGHQGLTPNQLMVQSVSSSSL